MSYLLAISDCVGPVWDLPYDRCIMCVADMDGVAAVAGAWFIQTHT